MQQSASRIASMATQEAYRHFYKTLAPVMTATQFPLQTLYSTLVPAWAGLIRSVTQSLELRQLATTRRTCFFLPYTLILCFADMCAARFSVDTHIHDQKYSGYSLNAGSTCRVKATRLRTVQNMTLSCDRYHSQGPRAFSQIFFSP